MGLCLRGCLGTSYKKVAKSECYEENKNGFHFMSEINTWVVGILGRCVPFIFSLHGMGYIRI